MKKLVCMLLCLLMLGSVLCACGKDETGTKTYTCENLTLTVPTSYKEQNDVLEDTGFNFCLESGGVGILGLREDMSTFSDMSAMEYAKLIVQANHLDGEPEDKGDYVLIEYTADMGIEYTYLACIYKNGYEFWTVQGFAVTAVYEKKHDQILEILTSAQID